MCFICISNKPNTRYPSTFLQNIFKKLLHFIALYSVLTALYNVMPTGIEKGSKKMTVNEILESVGS